MSSVENHGQYDSFEKFSNIKSKDLPLQSKIEKEQFSSKFIDDCPPDLQKIASTVDGVIKKRNLISLYLQHRTFQMETVQTMYDPAKVSDENSSLEKMIKDLDQSIKKQELALAKLPNHQNKSPIEKMIEKEKGQLETLKAQYKLLQARSTKNYNIAVALRDEIFDAQREIGKLYPHDPANKIKIAELENDIKKLKGQLNAFSSDDPHVRYVKNQVARAEAPTFSAKWYDPYLKLFGKTEVDKVKKTLKQDIEKLSKQADKINIFANENLLAVKAGARVKSKEIAFDFGSWKSEVLSKENFAEKVAEKRRELDKIYDTLFKYKSQLPEEEVLKLEQSMVKLEAQITELQAKRSLVNTWSEGVYKTAIDTQNEVRELIKLNKEIPKEGGFYLFSAFDKIENLRNLAASQEPGAQGELLHYCDKLDAEIRSSFATKKFGGAWRTAEDWKTKDKIIDPEQKVSPVKAANLLSKEMTLLLYPNDPRQIKEELGLRDNVALQLAWLEKKGMLQAVLNQPGMQGIYDKFNARKPVRDMQAAHKLKLEVDGLEKQIKEVKGKITVFSDDAYGKSVAKQLELTLQVNDKLRQLEKMEGQLAQKKSNRNKVLDIVADDTLVRVSALRTSVRERFESLKASDRLEIHQKDLAKADPEKLVRYIVKNMGAASLGKSTLEADPMKLLEGFTKKAGQPTPYQKFLTDPKAADQRKVIARYLFKPLMEYDKLPDGQEKEMLRQQLQRDVNLMNPTGVHKDFLMDLPSGIVKVMVDLRVGHFAKQKTGGATIELTGKVGKISDELIATEMTYAGNLRNFQNGIEKMLKEKVITRDEFDLFSVQEIIDAQNELFPGLLDGRMDLNAINLRPELFFKYCNAHTSKLRNANEVIKFIDADSGKRIVNSFNKMQKGEGMSSLAILPVQRLPRYALLFTELNKTEKHPYFDQMLSIVTGSLGVINSTMRK